MRRPLLRLSNFNIQTQLVVYYTIFALLAVGAVIYFSYAQAVKSLEATVEDKLSIIAKAKMDNLDRWVDEQQRNAVFLANLPELRSLSGRLLDPNSSTDNRNIAQQQLIDLLTIVVQRTSDFQDIQIVDLSGKIAVSTIPRNIGILQADQPFFREGSSKTFTQPFYKSSLLNEITLTIATPLFDTAQRHVGVLVLHSNMERVDEIMHETPGMNESVQSYLITPDRQIITDAPILLENPGRADSFGIFSVLARQEGSASYTNQYGVPVIGKYLWMPKHNAGLIVELDRNTALWPAKKLALNIAMSGIVVSLVLVLIAIVMARRITAPLRALSDAVSRLTAGELDASVPVTAEDEVGALARAFNTMTEKFQQTLAGLQNELRERKLAQDELLQYRQIMDEASDAIYMIEPQTSRYVDFNQRAHERLGYSRQELYQLGVIDVAENIENLQDWRRHLQLVRETGELIFETAYRRKDGTSFPVEVNKRMLRQEHGELLVASVRDITERKNAEKALRESEERFRKVFLSSPVAICITTLEEGRLLDANYAYWDLTGYDPHNSLGRDAHQLKMWDLPEERAVFVQDLKQRKSHFNPDDTFYHTDGTLKNVISFYELMRIGNEDCILAMFYDMSAQKQTMQALQQSEARIRALLNAFPDMVIELTQEGRIINIVPPKSTENSIPPEHLIGQQVQQIFPETIAEQTLHSMRGAIEADRMSVFEFEMEMGGSLRALEARLVVGASDTVLMLIRDITERKWIEVEREKLINELETKNKESETLRESLESIVGTFEFVEIIERILKQMKRVIPYDTASVCKVEGDQQIIISGVNLPSGIKGTVFVVDEANSAYPILKEGVPYLLNGNVQEELPDFQMEPHTYVQSWLAIPLRTRGKIIGMVSLDGQQKYQFTEHHAALAVTFANQVALALENARLFENLQRELETRTALITELENKNAEAETLRESAAIVAATLEKNEAIERILEQLERVIPFDSASVQLLYNDMLEIVSMRGFSLDQNDTENRFALDEREPSYAIFKQNAPYILLQDVQSTFEAFTRPPHNRIHAWLGVPLKAKGKILGIIALDGYHIGQFTEDHAQLAVTYANQVAITLENARLFSDLQAELSLRKNLITELESKNSELERFTYTVSHDLKSPLFTIRGFLGYLEQDARSGNMERLEGDIQRITEATEKMNRLLNELLELSRIGRLHNEITWVSLEKIAREAVDLVQGRIMERGITIDIAPNLPDVYGDYPRLVEVLQNLLDNAAKFMGDQNEPRIEIGQRGEDPERGDPIFYVCDNGMGIAPDHFERVFGLFNKLDPKTEGTGIGLALVKRIIEVHGGRVWVESELDKGTTFFFTLHQEGKGSHE
ncbi:MAG TPA: PAS domain S-box protein [Anaerolineales bacterium]|nr:PAS domain S-box protein [Anaerolineales bacterium]